MEKPVIKKKKGISPIWILPILALLIGGWLLYTSIRDAGIPIIVHFANAEGITAGKTKVIYKGIPIGVVQDITVDPGIDSVSLHIEMDKITKKGLVEDTKFWVVKPQVEAGRIRGLDTLLSGSYIAVQRGTSKVACREFIGLPDAPPIPDSAPGLHITLTAPQLGSVQRDTQIYYKNISIGSVQGYKLNGPGNEVEIFVYIKPEFKHLVHTKTRFWNSSGIHFTGGLSGFKFRMESLASLIYGGISLYTPEYQIHSPLAENHRVFPLYEDFDAAEFGLKLTLRLPSAKGIEPGITKVMYHGFKAGVVNKVDFDDKSQEIIACITLDPRAEFILREGTRFWVVQPEISINKIRNLETLVKGCYIAFQPGDGNYKDFFEVSQPPETEEILPAGKHFTLVSDSSGSLSTGAPILFRRFKVGEITKCTLTPNGKKIKADILVYQKYANLVKTNSVFWKSGGLDINAGLNGIKIEYGSIEALVAGGITFTNPPSSKKAAEAPEGHEFFTYEEHQDAVKNTPALQEQGLTVQLKTPRTKGFSIDSPILYKSIEVGKITDFHLDKEGKNIIIDAFIRKKFARLLKDSSLFYNISGFSVSGGISGIKLETGSLKSILAGGIAFFTPEPGKPASEGDQYVLYDNYQEARDIDKKMISIHFARPNGLHDDIEIRYQGIKIGQVRKVEFSADMEEVICRAFIDKQASRLFTSGTKIWLVSPEVSLSGIKNLDTIVGGSYITLRPGPGEPADEFVAMNRPPQLEKTTSGLDLILETAQLGSLKKGSPVYYRQVQIGQVTGAQLSPDAREVFVHINIEPPYDRLVYSNTRFWNTSGIRVRAGIFSGVKIDTESVEALVAGGISMATPEKEKGHKATAGQHFTLHKKGDENWKHWCPAIALEQ
ncbi:MAG: MCE family protein [Deltaproteobacteria bacterium]|nr:MCE family protein [Deltaproteobacteria bacterium]